METTGLRERQRLSLTQTLLLVRGVCDDKYTTSLKGLAKSREPMQHSIPCDPEHAAHKQKQRNYYVNFHKRLHTQFNNIVYGYFFLYFVLYLLLFNIMRCE